MGCRITIALVTLLEIVGRFVCFCMAAVSQYIRQVIDAIKNQDGKKLAKFLQIVGDDTPTARLELDLRRVRDISQFCSDKIETNYGEVIPLHILAFLSYKDGKWEESFMHQSAVLNSFQAAMQEDTRWALPALYTIVLDFRLIARRADIASKNKQKLFSNEESKLKEATKTLINCFRMINGDRSPLEISKRWGALYIVNTLLKINFQLNTVSMCKHLIKAIESPGFPDLQGFPISHLVTYKFYAGRLELFNARYKEAAEALSLAFRRCLPSKVNNRRQILISLIPAQMHLGKFPKLSLLRKYHLLEQFELLTTSIKRGNLRDYNRAMEQHKSFFIAKGIYLALVTLKLLTYRNLFKKVYLLLAKQEKIPLPLFVGVCQRLGIEMDMDEIECIFVNLIYNGLAKGYLSHKYAYIVLSQKNAFPSLRSK